MNKEDLRNRIDGIIALSRDDEAAHAREDELHLEIIAEFCPEWVNEEVKRLSNANFARWCA